MIRAVPPINQPSAVNVPKSSDVEVSIESLVSPDTVPVSSSVSSLEPQPKGPTGTSDRAPIVFMRFLLEMDIMVSSVDAVLSISDGVDIS